MSEEIPESVREYFGHDKVALFGTGGMPAAPPAPPGSPARRQGEAALADALAKVGSREPRPGQRPAACPPRAPFFRAMRQHGERALMEASMRTLAARVGAPPPHAASGVLWGHVFARIYRMVPWSLKKGFVRFGSGARGWGRS